MQTNEQEEIRSESVLAAALTKFGEIQTQLAQTQAAQVASTNERIDGLTEEMGKLVVVIARSEERHNTHTEKNERLEKNQIDLGKDLKEYKSKNDDRVVDIEKQVLLLENDDKSNKESAKDRKNLKNTIIGGVAIVGILALLSLAFGA